MALEAGNINAENGMSKAIYDALYDKMKTNFPGEQPSEEVCDGWKKLAYSIAFGVIEHIKINMEINGITAEGSVTTVVTGNTGQADGVIFTQNNDGTGHIQ